MRECPFRRNIGKYPSPKHGKLNAIQKANNCKSKLFGKFGKISNITLANQIILGEPLHVIRIT